MKYTFLYPYKNRVGQFYNTFLSLQHWYGERKDWEAVVILDGDKENIIVPEQLVGRIKQVVLNREGVNPALLFNMAAVIGKGSHLIITNPECYHVSDVLGWFDRVFEEDPDGYAVAACDHVGHIGRLKQYQEVLGKHIMIYQHSIERNALYHFCSAMSRTTWDMLGGFCEDFGNGYAYDDDDFRDCVLHRGITCYVNDTIKVLHQDHSKYKHTMDIRQKHNMNKELYLKRAQERSFIFNINSTTSYTKVF